MVGDARTGAPLSGASVKLVGGSSTGPTDAEGRFVLSTRDQGEGVLYIERIGYGSTAIELARASLPLVIAPEPAALDLEGLIVTGAIGERLAGDVLRLVSVVSGESLQSRLTGTVASTLQGEPGLWAASMGPAIALKDSSTSSMPPVC